MDANFTSQVRIVVELDISSIIEMQPLGI